MSAEQQVTDFITHVVKQMGLDLVATVETNADGTRINLEGEGLKRCSRDAAKAFRRCSTSSTARSAGSSASTSGCSSTA